MTSYFQILTIGAGPVQIDQTKLPSNQGGPAVAVNKILVQHAPGNTGNFKVGRNNGLTMAVNTPGIYVASTDDANPDASLKPGGTWGIDSYSDKNDIPVNQFFFHGSHAGDVLMVEITIKV